MCIKEGGKRGDIYGNAFVCNGDGSIQVNADGSPVNKTCLLYTSDAADD